MTCQRCGQAEAEWKVKETMADTGAVIRWWYLCDVCLLEDFRPWIGTKIPAVSEGQVWMSRDKRLYTRPTPTPSTSP